MVFLSLPVMPILEGFTIDRGQGYPSHVVLKLSHLLVSEIEETYHRLMASGDSFSSGQRLPADYIVVDDEERKLDYMPDACFFTINPAENLMDEYTISCWNNSNDCFTDFEPIIVTQPTFYIGKNGGFWVTVNMGGDVYKTVSKQISNIGSLLRI